MSNKLKGVGTAIVTPFHKDGTIDFKSLQKLVEYQIKGNVNFLVVLGTTGESVTLNKDEKTAVANFVVETVAGRVPVVLGLGGNNTQEVVNAIKNTDLEGISAILSVSPYYNKPQQRGIFLHYKTIANNCPLPVIIYNVPGRTGGNISAETTLKIANEIENVIGIKEASGNLSQCMKILKNRPADFLVLSGDDALTLPLMALGADGVISVVSNAFPSEFSEMVQLCSKGNFKKAQEIHYKLIRIIDALFEEGSPGGIKAVLEIKKICNNYFRLPIVGVSKAHYNNIATLLEEFSSQN
ncbi:MAG: 4-hydroxy-tetrahydrodipicolinate synthase [Bacteroidetes bacterium]|nr:4-hydroxy-tetrahydrodipicolinate synthase [Bacteroidota bacterium]